MTNFATVTEIPGDKASQEQLTRLGGRYYFARQFCAGKDVLEVACGAGQGLGYLAEKARRVVAGDIDKEILKNPQDYYKGRSRIELHWFDACELPFGDNSFDVVILFEAIYYLAQPEKFFSEAWRVLKKGGVLIIGTVNKDWQDFHRSPFSYKYYSVAEMFQILKAYHFQEIKFFAASPVLRKSSRDKVISLVKRAAVKFHLIPKTMKGRALFKRIFFGKLVRFPPEIKEGMVEYDPPVAIDYHNPLEQYKVFFAVAYK